jgi:ATP-dependent exoDNAse (exonuclease V) beta subunit
MTDEAIREDALDPTQSFIVQAPAGSGKTALLTQRFLVLLAHCEAVPEECLAITFTRKAAFEMHDRILIALQCAENLTPPTNEHEKRTWDLAHAVLKRDKALGWDLLQNPSRLKIQTIDAFCIGITVQMPVVSKFGSSPIIVEDPTSLYQIAARNLLKNLEAEDFYSERISTLLIHLDNNIRLAEQLLANMLSHRDQWLPYIGGTLLREEARQILGSGLQIVINETLEALAASTPKGLEEILELAQYAAKQLATTKKDSIICHCQNILGNWSGSAKEDFLLWQGLGELLLTQDHQWRRTVTEQQGFSSPRHATHKQDKAYFKVMKDRMLDCLSRLEAHPVFLKCLQNFRECPPSIYTEDQWQVIEALLGLLPLLTAQLSLVFQEKGQVDFIETTLAALTALGDNDAPTDLALGLDYKIRHILVDEFQDISLTQFRLLEKLTAGWQINDGRTLFLVGDPMQSIYRFRQAEVGLFIRAKQNGVGGIFLKTLNLTTNFRSDPSIVAWTNSVFKEKFPLEEDLTSGAVAFNISSAARASLNGAKAEVQCVDNQTEAKVVIELMKALSIEEPGSSIALLVRARSHLQTILPALRQAGIKYQSVQLELLADRPMVQDLQSLTTALLHLGDRIAWLALLRTPWIQFSLADLWVIANSAPALPIWHTLQAYTTVTGLSEFAKNRLAEVVPILRAALLNIYRLPLRNWIMEAWIALGGNAFLYDADTLEDIEVFFSILEEGSYDSFCEAGALERRIQKLYAKTTAPASAVLQVMTIHRAKGLEFDTVIVAGIGRRTLPEKLL